jgi:hypothetical protein
LAVEVSGFDSFDLAGILDRQAQGLVEDGTVFAAAGCCKAQFESMVG